MKVFAPNAFRYPGVNGIDYPYGWQELPLAQADTLKAAGFVVEYDDCYLPTTLSGSGSNNLRLATSANAASNTAAMQSAINSFQNFAITTPGIYPINFGLILPSNTDIYIGAGVTLQQAAGSNQNWFAATSEYNQTAVSTSSGIVSSWYGGAQLANGKAGSWNIGTLTFSGSLPANIATCKYIQLSPGITYASGVNGDLNGLYDGVFQVIPSSYNSSAKTIQFVIRADNGNDALAPSFVGSIMVATATANIRIRGKGEIDFNNQNTVGPATLLQGSGFVFNRTSNSIIKDITFSNVNQNIIQGANMYNCKFVDIVGNNSNGGIQFSGTNRDIYCGGWTGSFDDDIVAYMSSTGDTKLPTGGTGSLKNLTVENIHASHMGSRFVLLTGSSTLCDPSGVAMSNIVIRNNSSRDGMPYVLAVGSNGPVYGNEQGIINGLVIDNNAGKVGGINPFIALQTITINDNFTVSNITNPVAFAQPMIQFYGGVNFSKILVKDSNVVLDNSVYTNGIIFANSTTNNAIGDVTFDNVNVSTQGTLTYGAFMLQIGGGASNSWKSFNIIGGSTVGNVQYFDNQNTIGEINITGGHRWGSSISNYTAVNVVYRLNNVVITPTASGTGTFNIQNAGTYNLNFKDVRYESTNGPLVYAIGVSGATINVNIDGINGNPTPYSLLSNNGASGVNTWNVYAHNVTNNSATGFSNSSSYAATVNWNNPDGTLLVPFGGSNITTTKTNKGTFATPSNGSAPSGYTGTYVPGIPHVSDGTNFRSLANPTVNYY